VSGTRVTLNVEHTSRASTAAAVASDMQGVIGTPISLATWQQPMIHLKAIMVENEMRALYIQFTVLYCISYVSRVETSSAHKTISGKAEMDDHTANRLRGQ
jgi:hypothetical protein